MPTTSTPSAPPRPSALEERLAGRLLLALGPRVPRRAPLVPPASLAPFEPLEIARGAGAGRLGATYYAASGRARGSVLCLHPWLEWGQGYFHRRGRLEALRAAGYHALTIDLSGFGASTRARGFLDRDVTAALDALRTRHAALPLFVWGVSAGGCWAHQALAYRNDVAAAMFEDVSPHLLEWSERVSPGMRPFLRFFRLAFPRAVRFLDLRGHAPFLRVRAAAYVSGALDLGVPPEETETLARLAGGQSFVCAGAGHLGAIKRESRRIIDIGLGVFERALAR